MSNPSSISSANTANLMEFPSNANKDQQNEHKKRTRTLKSCLTCRQKKIKCDKAKPACSSCTKKGISHLCRYEEPNWSVKVAKRDQIHLSSIQQPSSATTQFGPENRTSTLKVDSLMDPKDIELANMNERIRQLEDIIKQSKYKDSMTTETQQYNTFQNKNNSVCGYENEFIDFYHNSFKTPINASQGALSWISLLRKDVYLNSISISTQIAKAILSKKANPLNSKTEEAYIEKWEREDHTTEGQFETKVQTSDKSGLLNQLRNYLKDAKLIWLLVDKFFESEFFLIVPIIDRDEFAVQLFDLIGSRGVSEVELSLKKRADLTTIGILLMIMRYSSLSSYNFGKPIHRNDENSQYILDHPIGKEAIELVNKINSEVSAFRSPNLDTYQFLILRIYYDYFSPEDCDCIRFANSSSIGQVLQYAIQCSLNRDPSTISGNTLEPKKKNMLRRLWYSVVYLDSYQLMSVGCPPIIDSKFYDTHFPHLDESEDEFEYTINEWFYERAKIYEICYPLLISILNVRSKITIGEVKENLQPLLNYIDKLKTIEEIVKGPCDTLIQRCNKIKDISSLLDCYSLLYMIYYHFFLFYNEKKSIENSLKYLLSVIKISSSLYELILFLDPKVTEYDLSKHFGIGAIVFPKIEMVLHRITQLMFAILSRIKGVKAFTSGLAPDVANILDEITDIATKTTTYILIKFVKVSDKYYHPWAVSKVQAFILTKILSIPKGIHFSAKSAADYQFIKALNRSRTSDEMFQHYSLKDFQQIRDEFLKFEEISNKNEADFANDSPWNSDIVGENDKRWLYQMINDYATPVEDNLLNQGYNLIGNLSNNFGSKSNESSISGSISNGNFPTFFDNTKSGINQEIPGLDLNILNRNRNGPGSLLGMNEDDESLDSGLSPNQGFNIETLGNFGVNNDMNSILNATEEENLHELLNSNIDLFAMDRFASNNASTNNNNNNNSSTGFYGNDTFL